MSTILALDIGSSSIKALLTCEAHHDLEVVGLGQVRKITDSFTVGTVDHLAELTASCEKAIFLAERMSGLTAKLTVVSLPSVVTKSSTTTINYTRENPNRSISDLEIRNLIKRAEQQANVVAHEQLSTETGQKDPEIRLVNSAIVSLTIDGYKVNNPVGYKGAKLTILVYTTFAPLVHIAAIEKLCSELDLELLAIATPPFANCRATLGNNSDSTWSGLLIDLGGKATDVAVVENGNILGTSTTPLGAKSLVRDFGTALPIWLDGLSLAIAELDFVPRLPDQIYLCGGGANLMEVQEALALSDWYQDLNFSHRPTIFPISPHDLPDFVFKTEIPLSTTFLTALGLVRIGLDALAATPEENTLRAKLARLLRK